MMGRIERDGQRELLYECTVIERRTHAVVIQSRAIERGRKTVKSLRLLATTLTVLGLACLGSWPLAAQTAPAAVVADPLVDKQSPPGLAMFTVPSHGVDLDAWLYIASGASPHGTVILAHGLPGYEMSGDLAQSIRRAGWNVLLFHYRGTWGVGGTFSQSSAIEDTAEVVRFLRDGVNAAKYGADPKRLVLIGHSFGGFIAGYEASHDPDIKAVAMIAAVNLGRINADPKEREARLKRWEMQLHPVRGATASGLFAEAERHAKDWDYVQWAEALRTRPVLLVEADDQNHADMEALASVLRQKSAIGLEQIAVPTDHSFSDHRLALQSIVVRWLEKLETSESQATKERSTRTKVVLLGTGTPVPDPDRSGPATAIVVDDRAYLVDFGPGVMRRAEAAALTGVTAVEPGNLKVAFVTHLHSDHTAGYSDLILTGRTSGRTVPLEVYGPSGLQSMTEHILQAYRVDIETRTNPHGPMRDVGRFPDAWKVNAHEIKPGVIYKDEKVTVTAFATKHAMESYGYRFDTPDRSIVISGDTNPVEETVKACNGCDVLVHEAQPLELLAKMPDSIQSFVAKYHTTTEQLAELANKAKPKLLVVYHTVSFPPGIAPPRLLPPKAGADALYASPEMLQKEIGSRYSGKFVIGKDLEAY
jgi:ribonuclease BN (tRNA processing enzyme)/pimeloyl-ACP methyl ester carboxylesterase